jgi:hypothetical protein
MKTYIWAESEAWGEPFEDDFMAVMAESLDDARKLAIEELSKTFDEIDIFNKTGKKCDIVNTTIPIILEPNTAMLIEHINP